MSNDAPRRTRQHKHEWHGGSPGKACGTLGGFVWLVVSSLLPVAVHAQSDDAPPTTPDAILEAAMAQNPSLKSAILDMRRADLALRGERYRYTPTVTLQGQYRRGQRPELSPTGVTSITNRSADVAPGMEHTFPAGTTLSGEFNVERRIQDSVFLGDLGTTWGTDATFRVVQPWLRGFGRDVGLAERRRARAEVTAAMARRNDEASRLARDVLTAYWELWRAQRTVEIQTKGLDVARRALEDGRVRLEAGAIGKSDLVPLQTEVARAREQLASARATRSSRRIELARLLGMAYEPDELRATDTPSTIDDLPGVDAAVERAREQSHSLREQRMRTEQARADAVVAEDRRLPELNTTASLSISGLGREFSDSVESFGATDGLVGLISLDLALPVVNTRRVSEARRAQLAVERAERQYESTADRIEAEVRDQLGNLRSARERLRLARETADLSDQNVSYQRTRFENGAATALDVAQTLQDKREADLRVAELRVEVATRQLALRDVTGRLLNKLALEQVESK